MNDDGSLILLEVEFVLFLCMHTEKVTKTQGKCVPVETVFISCRKLN